jgi:endonuclease/exonuclease/phosphatase family metal-dependent hydrolase
MRKSSVLSCVRFGISQTLILLAFAWSSGTVVAEPTQDVYRVLTYNIKRGLGNDGVTNLERTATAIAKLKPDFVGLQEVDDLTNRSGKVAQAAELGKQLGMQPAFAPFMKHDGGRYGMAILSKHPIEKIEAVELPTGHEPRVALAVRVRLPSGKSVMLVNVHFDWVDDDGYRFAQATKLKEYLNALEIPYLLLGDFNDQPGSRTLQLLGRDTVEAVKPRGDRLTFSSDDPKIEIDFVFAAPPKAWTVESTQVIDEPVVSDHRPVIAVLRHHPE